MLQVGDKAPDFNLEDQDGTARTLTDYNGKRTLFYFYPKDNTPGCTAEACSLRDNLEDLRADGLEVVGVSADSVKSHQGFAQKHSLPFTLLSDPEKAMIQAWGVWVEKSMYGRKYMGIARASFIVGPDLTVEAVWPKVSPLKHVAEVRKWLAEHK
ncbi:thioredoxin-dependent thiol peroxidase [bacterium]|nr:thioredoxin-dependent thiol peroxidase [bacterium]